MLLELSNAIDYVKGKIKETGKSKRDFERTIKKSGYCDALMWNGHEKLATLELREEFLNNLLNLLNEKTIGECIKLFNDYVSVVEKRLLDAPWDFMYRHHNDTRLAIIRSNFEIEKRMESKKLIEILGG